MAGKFEVYEDRAGKFRFRLKASNGEVVATGEGYETKASAKHGCEAVQRFLAETRPAFLIRRPEQTAASFYALPPALTDSSIGLGVPGHGRQLGPAGPAGCPRPAVLRAALRTAAGRHPWDGPRGC